MERFLELADPSGPVTRPPDRAGSAGNRTTIIKAGNASGKGSTRRDSGFALARPVPEDHFLSAARPWGYHAALRRYACSLVRRRFAAWLSPKWRAVAACHTDVATDGVRGATRSRLTRRRRARAGARTARPDVEAPPDVEYPEHMALADRNYDLVLYGASGFTGKQTVEYCRQFAPSGLRWAIAGRNRSKLDTVNSASVDVLVADAQDDDALNRLAAQTRVVATTAGPFSLYGTKLVDACVHNRTHYCDITGETPWIRRLIDCHHAQASIDGTRIITSCGFDSIPSDYGSWLVSRHIRDALQSDCVSVSAYFRVGGGINGGTLASFFHMLDSGEIVMARDPFLLDPDPTAHTAEERARNADPAGVHYDAEVQSWVTPFLMGMINTRVVRRTQALLGTRFEYQEYAKFNSSSVAQMFMIGSKIFEFIVRSGFGRRIIKPLLPQPGDGPSEKTMNEGFFECEFIGSAKSGERIRGIFKGQGDAGNRITVKCLCESAFVLALSSTAPSGAKPGGVLTPVTGLGDELTARLATAGIKFEFV